MLGRVAQLKSKSPKKAGTVAITQFDRDFFGAQASLQKRLGVLDTLVLQPTPGRSTKGTVKTPLKGFPVESEVLGQPARLVLDPPRPRDKLFGRKELGWIGPGEEMMVLHLL
jgi:hypothetical protein